MSPRHLRSIFVTAMHIGLRLRGASPVRPQTHTGPLPLPLDPAGDFLLPNPWFIPLSKFLATPLIEIIQYTGESVQDLVHSANLTPMFAYTRHTSSGSSSLQYCCSNLTNVVDTVPAAGTLNTKDRVPAVSVSKSKSEPSPSPNPNAT